MISKEEISSAKLRTKYSLDSQLHQHDDCVRIAYEWLDAQKKIKNSAKKPFGLKHLIENWAGRYVSNSDVCVAAELHPDIDGKYPFFNISSRLTEPSLQRLNGIGEAMKHKNYRDSHDEKAYKMHE
ncbi:hypothetical protein P4544_05405 [Halomonas sp. LY9]